jgi:hypothetical protein
VAAVAAALILWSRMGAHLSDLACLEWLRHGGTMLAPEDPSEIPAHLASCAECTAKLEGFRRLELLVEPYGSPPPAPRLPVLCRRSIWVLLAGAAAFGALRLLW